MKRRTAGERRAIEHQRRGKALPTLAAQVPPPSEEPATTAPRPRTSSRSGTRGWYTSGAWKRRSREHLKASPFCVVCGDPATISDHVERAHPDDRQAVLEGELQSMCWHCHQQKSCDDRAKRTGRKPRPIKRRVEIDTATGIPKPGQPWHWWSE